MKTLTRWFSSSVGFLLDNVAILLTAGFAGYVIYRQELRHLAVPIDDLMTAVLWILGLLAISELVERYRVLNRIESAAKRTLSLLEGGSAERPSSIAFFQKIPDISSFVQTARQIDLCGLTLTSTVNKQFGNLRESLRRNASIRLLVADPNSLALEMSSLRSEAPEDTEYYRKRLEAALQDIEYLYKSWVEHLATVGASEAGEFSVRLLSYAPSFGLMSFDTSQGNGTVFVEVFTHKGGFNSPPMFSLTRERDGKWFDYFASQFDEMWDDASPWTPSPPIA